MRARVVISGAGVVSPFGKGAGPLFGGLRAGRSAISRVAELEKVPGLAPRVAGIVPEAAPELAPGSARLAEAAEIPRRFRRSMSAMSVYACLAAREALAQAGLPCVFAGEEPAPGLGVCIGSTIGSPAALEDFFRNYLGGSGIENIKSMPFFRIMSHSAAANVAQAFGARGRVLAPASACSSGLQSIGIGYELIAAGRQEYMLCGGADEYHPLVSATFDILGAASTAFGREPEKCPRPFDKRRDGVVCSEGAGVLFLERLDSARARGAKVLAEIAGFACLNDPGGLASPDPEAIRLCMERALADAALAPEDVSYINAHATGTELGDLAESQAIAALFGRRPPVSSLKGHLGHTMAASGAIESIACLGMLEEKIFLPTRNLDEPDERCAVINLPQKPVEATGTIVVKNSFALGGINCTLVLRSI